MTSEYAEKLGDYMQGVPEFLTVKEVADLFRLGPMTVYRMCRSGEITSTRFGRSYRIYTRILMETHPVTRDHILKVTSK
jgi:excisionase family DNA binding protein